MAFSFGGLINAGVMGAAGALKGANAREQRDYERQQAEQDRRDRLNREALQMFLLTNKPPAQIEVSPGATLHDPTGRTPDWTAPGPSPRPMVPEWQQKGYHSFEDWQKDQGGDRRPEWQKQGYRSFDEWRADQQAKGQGAKPTTEQERNAAGLLTLIEDGDKRLTTFESDPQAIATLASKVPLAGNFITTEAARRYNNDMLQVVQSAIYALSGKAVTETEREALLKQYGYVPGDDPRSIADKARRRQVLIAAVRQMAGRAAPASPAAGQPGGKTLSPDDAARAKTDPGFADWLRKKGYTVP